MNTNSPETGSTSESTATSPVHPIDSPLDQVIDALGDELLRLPLNKPNHVSPVARATHGVQHAARVAILTHILLNLYRALGNPDALAITPRELRLLQLAALFHDSGRIDDHEEDHREAENAIKFIEISKKWLGDSLLTDKALRDEISMVATIIANKGNNLYIHLFELTTSQDHNTVHIYQTNILPHQIDQATYLKISLLSKILEIADGLEIIRCHATFLRRLCAFPTDLLTSPEENSLLLFNLIREIQQLLMHQGDLVRHKNFTIKEAYESSHTPYSDCITDILTLDLPNLKSLYNDGNMLSTQDVSFIQTLCTQPSLHWTLIRGIKGIKADSSVDSVKLFPKLKLKLIDKEINFLGKPKGNEDRSIASIFSGIDSDIVIGYQLNPSILQRIKFISAFDSYTGRSVKIALQPLERDEVQTRLDEIMIEKILETDLSYGELIGDIIPSDIEAFYYTKSSNPNINLFRQQIAYYYQQLFKLTFALEVPIIERDNISDKTSTVELNIEELSSNIFNALQEHITFLLNKDNKIATVLYGQPNQYHTILNTNLINVINIFNLNDRLLSWLEVKRQEIIESGLPSREMWYIIKGSPNANHEQLPVASAVRSIEIISDKYSNKIATQLKIDKPQEAWLKVLEKISQNQIENLFEEINALSTEDTEKLINSIIKKNSLNKEDLLIILNKQPKLSWATFLLLLNSPIYNYNELASLVEKITRPAFFNTDDLTLVRKTQPDSFILLSKLMDHFISIKSAKVRFSKSKKQFLVLATEQENLINSIALLCEYYLQDPNCHQTSNNLTIITDLITDFFAQTRSIDGSRYKLLPFLPFIINFIQQNQQILIQCNIFHIVVSEVNDSFNRFQKSCGRTPLPEAVETQAGLVESAIRRLNAAVEQQTQEEAKLLDASSAFFASSSGGSTSGIIRTSPSTERPK